MSVNMEASKLIGKNVKDLEEREIGRITSFLIDSSGHLQEVLIENKYGKLVKHPIEMLKIDRDEISLVSNADEKVKTLSEEFPVVKKKRKILDKLSEDKVLPPGIYENLCKEFDKILKEMKRDAQSILEDMGKEIKVQEDYVRTLQMARAFLEIEHGIGAVEEKVYQQSIMSLLKELKNAQQKKIRLMGDKYKVSNILVEKEEEPTKEAQTQPVAEPERETIPTPSEPETESETESMQEDRVIPVRVTQR
ncbi:MAG: hypothetical protein NWF14_00420 [Candidatus Bathyarchaeota archaeon]|nr:hypothetical protein [Candidatus Bathyarchaeota archaeon]